MLNLAGFGMMAWDQGRADHDPLVYRSTTVPVYDDNLSSLARHLEADAVIAHVRGIPFAPGRSYGPQNLHPFRYPGTSVALAHNGDLVGTDPEHVPGGVYVVFANNYEFTARTGDTTQCPGAGEAGNDETWAAASDLVGSAAYANARYFELAVARQVDMIFLDRGGLLRPRLRSQRSREPLLCARQRRLVRLHVHPPDGRRPWAHRRDDARRGAAHPAASRTSLSARSRTHKPGAWWRRPPLVRTQPSVPWARKPPRAAYVA